MKVKIDLSALRPIILEEENRRLESLLSAAQDTIKRMEHKLSVQSEQIALYKEQVDVQKRLIELLKT